MNDLMLPRFPWTVILDAGVIALSAWVVLSVFFGYTLGLHPILLLLALGMGFFYFRNHRHVVPTSQTGIHYLGIWIIVLFGALAFILFGLQGGFDLSADVAPVFATQSIQNRIPLAYPTHPSIPFSYPVGLPVLLSQLTFLDTPLHLLAWAGGVIGILLLLFYATRWIHFFIPRKEVFVLAPLLFLGLRIPFLSLLTGEYPLLLGIGLGLGAAWLWKPSPGWSTLSLGAAFLAHPYAGMVGFLFHGIFNRLPIRDWVRSGVGIGIVALPALIFQYIPLLGQIQGMGGIVGNSIPSLGTILAIPSLVGIIPFLLGVGVLIWAAFHRKRKPRDWERVAALLVGGGVLGYGLAGFFPAFVFGGKMIYLAAIGVMLAATGGIFSGVSPIHLKKTGIILLVLILGIWATSSSATHFIYGSKATIAEARFAEWFGNREAGGSKVLFLSPGHGKMGEYAGMLPFDFKSTHYFSSLTFQTVSNEATLMLSQDAARFQETLANRCLSCVKEFDAAFIVVNTSVFPLLPDHVLLYEKDGFLVYRGQ